MSYESKSPAVSGRQMVVQELAIPFITTVAGSLIATINSDEPSILYFKTEAIDQKAAIITTLGDTATYTGSAADDSDGLMSVFVNLGGDVCEKVVSARLVNRTTGVSQPVFLGSATGISTLGNIMLNVDSAINTGTTVVNASLIIQYVIAN